MGVRQQNLLMVMQGLLMTLQTQMIIWQVLLVMLQGLLITLLGLMIIWQVLTHSEMMTMVLVLVLVLMIGIQAQTQILVLMICRPVALAQALNLVIMLILVLGHMLDITVTLLNGFMVTGQSKLATWQTILTSRQTKLALNQPGSHIPQIVTINGRQRQC